MATKYKYDVFISYSRKDYVDEHNNVIPGNEVTKIKDALSQAGITFWFDEKEIRSGDEFTKKLLDNIEESKIFLFLSTKNTSESSWTSREIACADEFGKHIIPVRIDKTPYNRKVLFRIADISYIDYGKNPEKGLQEIVSTIKAYLNEIKVAEEQKQADEKRRQEEIIRNRQKQEEERKRQEQIVKIENEIAALESKKTDCKKAVLAKEKELRLAQVDLDACETKIQRLQKKLQELRNIQIREHNKKEKQIEYAEGQLFTVGDVSYKMILVEGGSFWMGAQHTDQSGQNYDDEAYDNESPVHNVTVNSFYMSETVVTQALWKAVMGTTVSQQRDKAKASWPLRGEGDNYPMYNVSYNEVVNEFLPKLNQLTGKNFRLPTEAEWEYAAKGGNNGNQNCYYKYAGGNTIDDVAWYEGNSGEKTHEVKTKLPNELGIYDMSGNVWEWCNDWYGRYGSSFQQDPTGPTNGEGRVLRGGSWLYNARRCRVMYRGYNDPDSWNRYIGFRLVLPL